MSTGAVLKQRYGGIGPGAKPGGPYIELSLELAGVEIVAELEMADAKNLRNDLIAATHPATCHG